MSNNKKYNVRHTGRNIWIIVLILILIILLTWAYLSGLLGSFIDGDRNTINIADSSSAMNQNQNHGTPDVLIESEDIRWETDTSINLFREFYTNEDGSITVLSGDDYKVIAPGTSNEYEFTIKNTGSSPVDYVLTLDSIFTLENHDLPMVVRLHKGDEWLIGSEDEWVAVSDLTEVTDSDSLDVNYSNIYVFEWQWPFECGEQEELILNNLNDTLLGNASVNSEVEFTLNIKVDSSVNLAFEEAETGSDKLPILPLVLFALGLITGCGFIWLIVWRTPVYVTGFVPGMAGHKIKIGNKEEDILVSTRFIFNRIYTGKHKIFFDDKAQEYKFKLHRKSKLDGIEIEIEKDLVTVSIGRKVQAIELYMTAMPNTLIIRTDDWAAIDKKCNVITPLGIKKPDDGYNITPGGLSIDKHKNLSVIDASK